MCYSKCLNCNGLSLSLSASITNEAGASIYSVSPEAVKEMPDLDPNLRSAGQTNAHVAHLIGCARYSKSKSKICEPHPFSIEELEQKTKVPGRLAAPRGYAAFYI